MKPNVLPKQDLTATDQLPGSLLESIQSRLKGSSETPYLDSLVLLGHITGLSKSRLIAHPSPPLDADQDRMLSQALEQLLAGIPLPYVLGEWEFFLLRFTLSKDVLIPRPETEGLVERAIDWLQDHPGQRSCLDVGTGSGCIAISLLAHIPDLRIAATDISLKALLTAQVNARSHGVERRIDFLQADLLNGIQTAADLLVANLPYIPTQKLESLPVSRTEPWLALDGGPDGLSLIKRLLEDAPRLLKPGGLVLLELDEDCGQNALKAAEAHFPLGSCSLEKDLSGQDRYLVVKV
jgi:release factor glutamine methyltransferase